MSNIQNGPDDREIPLDRVGITGLVYPVMLPDRQNGTQTTEATIGLFVDLGQGARGTHMSRFVEILEGHRGVVTPESIEEMLAALRDALNAASSHAEIECTFFVSKTAPVSGAASLMACPTRFDASLKESFDLVLTVEVPVMTVCPCSKEATGGPAHSQRGHVAVSVRTQGRVWIEEIVELVEQCASAPVYPLLRGEDEASVIAAAHEKPVLVEDVVRNVAERLDSDVRIRWYQVEAENLDSVHDHNLYACVERSH